MFLISRPTTNQIEHFLQEAATTAYSYADVGASRQGSDSFASYNIDHNQIVIGDGEDDCGQAEGVQAYLEHTLDG